MTQTIFLPLHPFRHKLSWSLSDPDVSNGGVLPINCRHQASFRVVRHDRFMVVRDLLQLGTVL